jgi:hypothetical protein
MDPELPPAVGRALERMLCLGVVFAVLWVRGYLWWALGVAALVYLSASARVPVVLGRPEDGDADDGPVGPDDGR